MSCKHIYFMSICGTGMGNAALLLREAGHRVSGADQNTYPPMSDRLAEAGIDILHGYDAGRLQRLKPDLVVVGNVNTRGNPEVEWLLQSRRIRFVSLPELLSNEVLRPRQNIVVSGTHGKTTTTCLCAFLMRANGADPGYLVGGVPRDLPSGAALGDPEDPFVIEGDEYDSAFFDKRSKFIHYWPSIVILNNLEFDHADIFRDLEDVSRSFRHLLKLVPENGQVLANADDAHLRTLLDFDWAPVHLVGAGADADLRIDGFAESATGSRFSLYWKGRLWGEVKWRLWGLFNARNAAMAALAAGLALFPGHPDRLRLEKLNDFQGVKRRQETLFDDDSVTIITDFAHHPSAIRQTLEALRQRYPGRTLTLCFEARSNTACRNLLEDEFEAAFGAADRIHLGEVFRAERYRDDERIDLPGIARRLGPRATAHSDNRSLLVGLKEALRKEPGQVVCFFSNGSFDGIPQQLVVELGQGML